MCGRNGLNATVEELENRYNTDSSFSDFSPSYNIAPESKQPVVREGSVVLQDMEWSFVPEWTSSREEWLQKTIINGRIETVHENNLFQDSFRENKALIPSTGFYEWKKTGNGKVPYRVFREGWKVFSMAGFHSDGTFCILTKESHGDFKNIHDRVPVVLRRKDEMKYLNGEMGRKEIIKNSVDQFSFYQVTNQVNNPGFEGEKCYEKKKTLDNF